METTVAEVQNVSKSFGANHVLKNFSLKINKGENLVIFGKSGSGKSVLIKCLVGLIEPDAGKIDKVPGGPDRAGCGKDHPAG
jgi:phospholipid/cholesterol/gamma-HCH transport system ATP-binding protein